MKLLQQNKWRVTTAAGMFALHHKWGDTASAIDPMLGAFLQKFKVENNAHLPSQRQRKLWHPPLPLNCDQTKKLTNNKSRKCAKNHSSGGPPPLFLFEPPSHIQCWRDVAGSQLMWGEGDVVVDHVFCALCRNWVTLRDYAEGYCQPQEDIKRGLINVIKGKIHHRHSASRWEAGVGKVECVLKAPQWLGTHPPPLALHCSA